MLAQQHEHVGSFGHPAKDQPGVKSLAHGPLHDDPIQASNCGLYRPAQRIAVRQNHIALRDHGPAAGYSPRDDSIRKKPRCDASRVPP